LLRREVTRLALSGHQDRAEECPLSEQKRTLSNSSSAPSVSTTTERESVIAKGGMCFIDPDYAANVKHAAPATLTQAYPAKPGDV
jgi:hypothetical protein